MMLYAGDPFIPRVCGWIDHPAGVQWQMDRMPFPNFRTAAASLFGTDTDKDILLYKALKDVLGKYPDYVKQLIGDCTSWASAHVTDLTECIQIAIDGAAEMFKETCSEAIYGAGRELANMLGQEDGCYGAAMARAVTEIGTCPREAVGAYSGQRAKEWGRTGTPAEVKRLMADHKMGAASQYTTLDELDAGLGNCYIGIVCSNQAFELQRDEDGFCAPDPSTQWPHAMAIVAKRVTKRRGYLIFQSWGPNVPSGPLSLDQPDFSFWAAPEVVARMIGMKDSFLFSKLKGYAGRPVPSRWTYARAA